MPVLKALDTAGLALVITYLHTQVLLCRWPTRYKCVL